MSTVIATPIDVDAGLVAGGAPSSYCLYYRTHGGEPLAVLEDPSGDSKYERYLDETFGVNGWAKQVVGRDEVPHHALDINADGTPEQAPALHVFKVRDGKVDTGTGIAQAAAAAAILPDVATVRRMVSEVVADEMKKALKTALA